MIWSLIVGGLIGAVAGMLTSKADSRGIIFNVIAGLVGSWLGQSVLGNWGPSLAGMAIFPSILGAVVFVIVVSFITGRK